MIKGNMKKHEDHILDAATRWFVMLQSDQITDMQWEEYISWLEADPAHKRAYDLVAKSDFGLEQLKSNTDLGADWEAREAANDNRRWIAAAISTVAIIMLAIVIWPQQASHDFQRFETPPGSTREIALDDGTQIALNGDSKVEVDMAGQRLVRLLHGEAAFNVDHDSDNPFTVEIGAVRFVDAGTMFNVTREQDDFTISVSEGQVILNPDKQALVLDPGYSVSGNISDDSFRTEEIDPESVGSWRDGRLLFNNKPLSFVAAALQRSLGSEIVVTTTASDVIFTGAISLDGDEGDVMKRVEGLSGVVIQRDGKGWRMGP